MNHPPGLVRIGWDPDPYAVNVIGFVLVPELLTLALPVKVSPRSNATTSPATKVEEFTFAKDLHANVGVRPELLSLPALESTK